MPPRIKVLRAFNALLTPPTSTSFAPLLAPFLLPAQQRSASILSSLSDTPGAYNKKIRRGRGPASGKGKTAGRGQKGQHAHGKVPTGFNGGQTKLEITQPARGSTHVNHFEVNFSPLNLDRLQSWIDQGRLDPSKPITMKELNDSRCLHGVKDGVKLLAKGAETLKTPVNIVVSRASATAISAVESTGGTVTTRFYSPVSIRRVLKGLTDPIVSLQSPPTLLAIAHPTATSETSTESVLEESMKKYPYRLPDPTGRKDIEYYRDVAHRGYLSHLVKEGESPSLFFKVPGVKRDQKQADARKKASRASAENRIW